MRPAHRSHVLAICALCVAFVGLAPPIGAATTPRRIVSTFLCTDEYVFRLVPRERIAALSFLAADTRPVVSTIVDQVHGIPLVRATAEQVLTLHPDLVVTYQNTNLRMTQLLRAAGVNVLELPWAQSLADVRRITRLLGKRLGAEARADALIAHLDAVLAAARANAPRPPVRTLVYEPNGYATAGGVTDEILSTAGLQNVSREMHTTRSGTLPIEAMLMSSPQLLILNGENGVVAARADLVLNHPALRDLTSRAVVARTSLLPLLCPGPWSADVTAALSAWGHRAQKVAAGGKRP